jgi:quercetin dioxygenase-like cupin family protein
MSAGPVVKMPGEAKAVTLAGRPLTFLVTGEHTRHTSMFEWTVAAGFSTGMHVHRVQEETFYLLEGTCEWQIGDRLVLATPGTFLFVPPGIPHNIANASATPAKLLMTVSPPGHERYFEILGALTAGGARPTAEEVGTLRQRFDTDQLSALGVR